MPEEVLLNTFSPPQRGLGARDRVLITSSGTGRWHGGMEASRSDGERASASMQRGRPAATAGPSKAQIGLSPRGSSE